MNDSDTGLEKPGQGTLTALGVPGNPLAPLSTLHQGPPAVARMTSMSQGARGPSNQSSASNGVGDNPSLSSLLSGHISGHPSTMNSTNPMNTRKRKLPPEEYVILRRKVAEDREVRMNRLQTKFAENCALLCFLQGNGHPADYSSWRTRLPAVQLNSFLKTNKLDPSNEDENLLSVLQSQNQSLLHSALSSGRLQGSGVAEVQPPKSLSPGNLSERRSPLKHIVKTPAIKSSTPVKQAPPQTHGTNEPVSSQEQIVERAKQEAYVMQRIGELQRDGLWAEKRLPKVHEIPRAKAHWDYLLEEMAWLAADFAQERKWKKAAAKKCARMVQKHFQDKEVMAQKAVKNQELQLKRIASIMAKEVKQFWANVEKLVEFKTNTRLEEKRKKALDQHLSFIVDQTEKYSSLVAESMNTSCPTSPKHHSDVEFEPDEGSEDDEETIAKEEALAGVDADAVIAEVDALKRESELPLEDLLSDYLAQRDNIKLETPPVNDDDEDFKVSDKDSSDDEETIQEQEMNEGEIDYKQEIDELKADGDLTLEELKAKYNADRPPSSQSSEKSSQKQVDEESENASEEMSGLDSDDESGPSEDEKEEEEEGEDSEESDKEEVESEKEEDSTLKTLFTENTQGQATSCADKDKEINDVAAIAQSLQPKGNTLSSTSVVTKIPFLLKHNLREYQHIGLDWLVTMYERKLNGILADEMGLGKTIQTIALCAHLACEKGNWGPHLIVVPTSVMLNWEMEFKKWCPAFKILTYYGSQKERKLKRSGWTKPNAFHICITSYKLVIQDHQSFRRKKWKYLILDEAQNIKNFKSQRWQLLLNFQTQRRLLLTGTPLQNNLMELWSLMHFLMPSVFESHREFKEWFSNPVTGMIEGNSEYNENIIKRLHKVLRPFLLRRLKSEVETQMPKKYEHVVMCRLSNRQRYLYEDFMSRAKTRETLASGNLLSVINVLMQLRKVCNHPNLFEVRPTVSPFQMEPLRLHIPSLVWTARDYNPLKHIDLLSLNLKLVEVEFFLLALDAYRIRKLQMPPSKIMTIDEALPEVPPCPHGNVRISMPRKPVLPCQTGSPLKPALIQVSGNNHRIISSSIAPVRVGTSPLIKTIVTQNPGQAVTLRLANPSSQLPNYLQILQQPGGVKAISVAALNQTNSVVKTEGNNSSVTRIVPQFAHFVNTPSGRQLVLTPQSVITSQGNSTTTTVPVMTSSGTRLALVAKQSGGVTKLVTQAGVNQLTTAARPIMRVPPLNLTTSTPPVVNQNSIVVTSNSSQSATTATSSSVIIHSAPTCTTTTTVNSVTAPTKENASLKKSSPTKGQPVDGESSPISLVKDESLLELRKRRKKEKLALIARTNKQRCTAFPMFGQDLIESVSAVGQCKNENILCCGACYCYNAKSNDPSLYWSQTKTLSSTIHSVEDRVMQLSDIFSRFVLFVPPVTAPRPQLHVSHPPSWKVHEEDNLEEELDTILRPKTRLLHPIASAMATQFPDPRLIQYDCGKLQSLDRLLRKLKSGQHRVLIFTQMTRMLDVLEAFLNFHGHIYLRLDGTTKVDQRQVLMERFNADKRIFCFILSTRSGGVGVNLTGADTVIFYDSDWNPTMDAQAQDRCHRIGQTRDVHIYRLVSEKTVEENILKKANQKRMLGDLAIEGGNFTTAYFKSSTIQDLFNVDTSENDASRRMAEILEKKTDKKTIPIEEPTTTPAVNSEEKSSLGALESALAQAEDETDVAAAKVAKAEAAADLAEFDENIPLEQQEGPELSKAEMELNALIEQLSGVEKYAMKFVEDAESAWAAEQLAAAEAEIEQQKREWELGRLTSLKEAEEEERRRSEAENEDLITYSGSDARNQLWVSQIGNEVMPMWCPPTPPQDDNDVYIDNNLSLLYEPNIIPETSLPPVFIKKDRKRSRLEAGFHDGRHPIKIRQREEALMHAPKSLFDRPTPAMLKMRQELRLQRYRGLMRPSIHQNIPKSQIPVKPLPEPEHVPDWVIQEDWAILQAIQQIQELTLNLVVISPGHTPNWDLVADVVNMTSRTYRSAKQCRNRYESVIIPREEGKVVLDSPKKQKKSKNIYRPPQIKTGRPVRTSQLYQQDNNSSMTQVLNSRFDAIRSVSNRRAPTVKPLLVDPAMKNPKHAEVLADCSIDYDKPLTPVEVATKRAERIAREKQQQVTTQQTSGVNEQQMAAVLRIQQQQLQKPTASSPTTTGTGATTQVTSTTSSRPVTTLAVQEMVVGTKAVIASSIASPQPKPAANIVSVQSSSVPTSITASKGAKAINPAQLQVFKHQQAIMRQNQLRILHSRANAAATTGQKVSVAVTSSLPSQRVQQVKAGGVTRTVTEPEMLALFKRKGAATTLSSPQLITQSSLQGQHTSTAQVGQVATIVKTVPASSLPVSGLTLPQMKAALSSGVKAGTVTTQQIRQLSIQSQVITQQRKLHQQKVAQIGQVAGKGGPTAQLIVQSQKSLPTTMTMQQIHQVMKQVQPQQVVVSASSPSASRPIPIEANRTTLAGTIKAGNNSQQQAILTQVSAVLQQQQGQPITVRQPVRIQTSNAPIVAVAVTQAPTVLTLPPDNSSQQQQQQ